MQSTTINYVKPLSHSKTQTRWVLEAGSKCFGPSIKIIDFLLAPNQASYWPALIGSYSCIKSLEIKLNGKRIDYWEAREYLPYLLSAMSSPEQKVGVDSVLYGIGNNVSIDVPSQLLSLNLQVVDQKSVQMKLKVMSDLLNNIGCITDKMEIFVNWMESVSDVVVPVDPTNPAASMNIGAYAPYLSYETMIGDFKQADKPQWHQLIRDVWTIPAIEGDNTQQAYELRSNAFSGKFIHRLLLANLPVGYKTATDCQKLYQTFGGFMSVPMKQESWNIAMNGRNILSFRNSSNNAVALSIVHDSLSPAYFTSNAHIHSKFSPLLQLVSPAVNTESDQLNGYAAYGGLEISDRPKELALSYRRTSDVTANWPSLTSALNIIAVGSVLVSYVNGEKVYI
jgi:hypothetical protein